MEPRPTPTCVLVPHFVSVRNFLNFLAYPRKGSLLLGQEEHIQAELWVSSHLLVSYKFGYGAFGDIGQVPAFLTRTLGVFLTLSEPGCPNWVITLMLVSHWFAFGLKSEDGLFPSWAQCFSSVLALIHSAAIPKCLPGSWL